MRDELVKNNLLPDIGPVTLSLLVMYSVQFWLTVTKSKIVYGIWSFQNLYQSYE